MNAIGDATMALSFFVLILHTGSLSFADAFNVHLSSTTMTFVALGLLGGAAAKSAQIPLHTWLPDAMEGPTPVSALIHAATMVTAGIYLIARTHPIFEQARPADLVAPGIDALPALPPSTDSSSAVSHHQLRDTTYAGGQDEAQPHHPLAAGGQPRLAAGAHFRRGRDALGGG